MCMHMRMDVELVIRLLKHAAGCLEEAKTVLDGDCVAGLMREAVTMVELAHQHIQGSVYEGGRIDVEALVHSVLGS